MNNKQLLQKYVDTGVQLPEYQVRSLPDNLKNTYIRKRLISVEQTGDYLEDYEFEVSTPDQQIQYIMKRLEKGGGLSNEKFKLLAPDQRFQYAMKMVEKGGDITINKFEILTPDQRLQYVMKMVENGREISYYKFELLTPEQRKIFKDKGGKIY